MTLSALAFALVEAVALLPHEQVEPDRLARLVEAIRRDGCLYEPVLVDRGSLVILDGHHRVQALRALGCRLVPVYLVDYRSPAVRVGAWRAGLPVDKEAVVARGLAGTPYPPRTSRHVLEGAARRRPVDLGILAGLGASGEVTGQAG